MGKPQDIMKNLRGAAESTGGVETPREVAPPAPRPAARRAKEPTTRTTIGLPDSEHRALRRMAVDSGIDAQTIIRALLSLMRSDKDLERRVQEEVERLSAQ